MSREEIVAAVAKSAFEYFTDKHSISRATWENATPQMQALTREAYGTILINAGVLDQLAEADVLRTRVASFLILLREKGGGAAADVLEKMINEPIGD
jgi:hypothetical protein